MPDAGAFTGPTVGLAAVPDCASSGAVEDPGELLVGCAEWSIGGAELNIGAIIGLAAVTDWGGGAADVPAGRTIGDDDAGVIVWGTALDMDAGTPFDCDGGGALPFDLRGLRPATEC